MEYRQLGTSGVNVSEIIFGAWAVGGWMWGGSDEADAIKAIQTAIDLGVTTIDTAPAYGYGYSEELVGRAIRGRRDKVQVLTKFGLRWDLAEGQYFFEWKEPNGRVAKIYKNSRAKSVIHECEECLRRLGIDVIDLFQCHWRDETTPLDETMGAMDTLRKAGKIRAAGVSNFTVEWIDECRKAFPIASDQPPYSMVNRGIEKDVLPHCHKNKVGVIVYSPMERGLLTGKITENHKFNPGDHRATHPSFAPGNIRKVNAFLRELQPIADAHKATLAQLVISWTTHRPGITAALVGARNPKQAAENAGAAAVKLSKAETQRIDELVDGIKLEAVQGGLCPPLVAAWEDGGRSAPTRYGAPKAGARGKEQIAMTRKHGLTLTESLVVLALVVVGALLVAILMPPTGNSSELRKRMACGARLNGIGKGVALYKSGQGDMTPWIRSGDWSTATGAGGVASVAAPANLSVTALSYLLIRDGQTPELFVCPGNPNAAKMRTSKFTHTDGKQYYYWDFFDPNAVSDSWRYVSYSFRAPLWNTKDSAFASGFTQDTEGNVVIGADRSPAFDGGKAETNWAGTLSSDEIREGMSRNHSGTDPQINLLYADTHVGRAKRADVGYKKDNIYSASNIATEGTQGAGTAFSERVTDDILKKHLIDLDSFLVGPNK